MKIKLIKLLRKFFRKKKLKIIDISTGKDVSKYIEISFPGRISIPKDDDKRGNFTKYSDIAP